jgi:hypothetical protein
MYSTIIDKPTVWNKYTTTKQPQFKQKQNNNHVLNFSLHDTNISKTK